MCPSGTLMECPNGHPVNTLKMLTEKYVWVSSQYHELDIHSLGTFFDSKRS